MAGKIKKFEVSLARETVTILKEKRGRRGGVRFHILRHTFATRLAQSGVDIYKIARLLGHKDIKMTQEIRAPLS